MNRIKPWMVVVTLVVVAAGGATAVFFVADAQHDRDRADITKWLENRFPAAQDAARVVASHELFLTQPVTSIRSLAEQSLANLRADETALLESPIPEILQPMSSRYLSSITLAELAFDAASEAASDGTLRSSERERYAALWRNAMSAFSAADGARQDLLCRARMPQCKT